MAHPEGFCTLGDPSNQKRDIFLGWRVEVMGVRNMEVLGETGSARRNIEGLRSWGRLGEYWLALRKYRGGG